MGNEVSTQASFEERLGDRIRKDIGDLLTDRDLKKIVRNAMEKSLNRDVKDHGGWNSPSRPWIEKTVDEAVSDRLQDVIKDVVKEHDELLLNLVKQTIEKNLPMMISGIVMGAMQNFGAKMSLESMQTSAQYMNDHIAAEHNHNGQTYV